ncbi:hypothetical protein [Methylobacterium indicum]|uniref:hypothetical protein n=1 Tax=Methylobacterium indicum TaxID=1775910 RepID=UPI001A915A76|nr:hypothetical protein [Methylobacterium indicum]
MLTHQAVDRSRIFDTEPRFGENSRAEREVFFNDRSYQSVEVDRAMNGSEEGNPRFLIG